MKIIEKNAFIKFCEKNEIDYNKYLIEGRYSMESGYQMMNEILEKKAVAYSGVCCK